MSFRKRLIWLICSGCLAVVVSDRVRAVDVPHLHCARGCAALPAARRIESRASVMADVMTSAARS